MRLRRIAPVVVLAAAAVMATFPSTAPAHAATVTGLPITSVYQVVAASAQGRIFISQGPDAGADAPIVVTNLSGTPVATIGDGARGLALSANDETLYAATGDAVTAFSTTTLKQTASYPAPGLTFGVAIQSGRLWVSYDDSSNGLGEVGGIDLADPSASWNSVPGEWYEFPPAIAADPSDTGTLVASGNGLDGVTAASYHVSDPTTVTQIASSTSVGCGNNGLSVLPGGKTFLCDDYPYSAATMAPQDSSGTYATGFTAVAPDGAIAAGVGGSANGTVWAYPKGVATPTASYSGWDGLSLPYSYIVNASAPVGFAWSVSSEQLFTIIETWSNYGNPIFTLLSLYPFERVPADLTDLTLTSTATTVQYGASATITAHLGVTYSNRTISFYDAVAGGPRYLDRSEAANDPSGDVVFPEPSLTRNEVFTAVFSGDSHYAPATVNLAVKVGVKIAASPSGYYKTAEVSGLDYHHAATLENLITVTPAKPGECVRFQVEQGSHGVWGAATTTGCVALNRWSQTMMTRKLGPTGWFRVRADFTPSAKDAANVSTDGSWVYYEVTR